MQMKASARGCSPQPDERKRQLEAFVETAIQNELQDRPDAVLLVARSPDSPVARAVFALSDALAHRRLGGRIVFACSEAMATGDVWQLAFDPRFVHETRLASDPRVLGAHEQLIVGDSAVWFGDSMRRDPLKRDAFQAFQSDASAAAAARRTFARFWDSSVPLYGHGAAATATDAAPPEPPATAADAAEPALQPAASDLAAADVAATLAGWQPAIKH